MSPDASGKQALILAHVMRGDMKKIVSEVHRLGPVVRVDEAHFYFVNEGVLSVFLHLALRLDRFVRADVVICQGVVHDLQTHLNRDFIGGGAVLA